jgi:hypothetical protein
LPPKRLPVKKVPLFWKRGDTRTFVFEKEEFSASRINAMGRSLATGLESPVVGLVENNLRLQETAK